MTSPYLFDSSDDYYDSLLTPVQRHTNRIMENDPVGYLDERGLLDDLVDTYFEELMDYMLDKGYTEAYIEDYLKKSVYAED